MNSGARRREMPTEPLTGEVAPKFGPKRGQAWAGSGQIWPRNKVRQLRDVRRGTRPLRRRTWHRRSAWIGTTHCIGAAHGVNAAHGIGTAYGIGAVHGVGAGHGNGAARSAHGTGAGHGIAATGAENHIDIACGSAQPMASEQAMAAEAAHKAVRARLLVGAAPRADHGCF